VQQIGRYKIVEEIGRGASGVVYRALDPAIFGRTIAIKIIRLTGFGDAFETRQLSERLVLEAKAVAQLSHRNIISLYDVDQEDGTVQIFMEFVNGPSLNAMLSGHNLPANPALLDFFRQVADGLDYAHRNGIVHRDVKPANLMLHEEIATGERQAKITDFGVANFASHPTTHTGLRGTPSYMAPEQVDGSGISGKTDQFALAAVAYEVLTGRKAFAAQHLSTLLYRILKQEPEPAHLTNQTIRPLTSKILSKALSKNPAQRYETCTAFVTALVESLNANPQWVAPAPYDEPIEGEAEVISDETLDAALHPPHAAQPIQTASGAGTLAGEAVSAGPFGAEPGDKRGQVYELPPLNRRRRPGDGEEAGPGLALWRKVAIVVVLAALFAACFLIYERFLSQSGGPTERATTKPPAAAPAMPPMPSNAPGTPPGASSSVANNPESGASKSSTGVGPPRARGRPLGSVQPALPSSRQTVPPSAVESRGPITVQFSTSPPAAHIVVDGDESQSCTTPCGLPLRPGRHTFTVALSGYGEARRIIQVPDQSTAFVELTPEVGVVQIASVPSGSTVYIDGQMRGQTPATLRIKAGRHQVRLVSGSKYHEETIDVNADSVQSFTFRWAR
jgi:tRNA A-37 threonylcarbamoyl transferase component Bud32